MQNNYSVSSFMALQAQYKCDASTTMVLLKEGAEVDTQDVDGNTALHMAIMHFGEKTSPSE